MRYEPQGPDLTSEDDLREQREMLDALNGAGGIDRITFEVMPDGLHWRLGKEGREIWHSGPHTPDEIPLLLQGCEILMNTEYGIAGERLCQPGLN